MYQGQDAASADASISAAWAVVNKSSTRRLSPGAAPLSKKNQAVLPPEE